MNFSDFLPQPRDPKPSNDQENGHLIENSTRHQLFRSLHRAHNNRLSTYSYVFNFLVLSFMILVGGFTLYYCRKQKLTPYEAYQRRIKDQQHVLTRIRQFQEDKLKGIEKTYAPNL